MAAPSRLACSAFVLLLSWAGLSPHPVMAQAILHPNQVQVSLVFTNTNPEIRAILDAPVTSGVYSWSMNATSVGLSTGLTAWSGAATLTRAGASGEITVESSDVGIRYDVRVVGYKSTSSIQAYESRTVQTIPVQVEPAPDAVVDFAECAGLLRLRLLDAGGAPVVATGGTITAKLVEPGDPRHGYIQASDVIADGSTSVELLVRGDSTFDITARYTVGSDAYSDMVTYEIKLRTFVPCDGMAAVDGICSGGSGGDPLEFGRIVGVADVLGEEENPEFTSSSYFERTSVRAAEGPWGNYRYDRIQTVPASGSFELERLVPSTVTATPTPYSVRCRFSLREGFLLEDLEMDLLRVTVDDGETHDLSDTCVIDPALLRGPIFLAGPPAPPPPLVAPLGTIFRAGDLPRPTPLDGLVHSHEVLQRSRVSSELRSDLVAGESTGRPGLAASSFAGALDTPSGEVRGSYELVVGGFHAGGTTVDPGHLTLALRSVASPDTWPSYINASVGVKELAPATHVAPGDVVDDPIRQCHSTIMMSYLSTGVPFTAPRLALPWYWRWAGVDFEGRRREREVSLYAYGTPTSVPSTTGLVVTSLPEGQYHLLPTVNSVNPGGGISLTEILPVDLSVGCREIIALYPDFVLGMSQLPPCTEDGTLSLRGQVSGSAPVARITWQVNADPVQTSCVNCGVAPSFELPIAMSDRDATVVVTAEAADGRVSTRTAFSRFAPEPSATDRSPGAPALLVSKLGGGIVLTWESIPGKNASVYRGNVNSLHAARAYDHAGFGACHVSGGAMALDTLDAPGSHYFLIGTPCGWGDSSLGRDSLGTEHPPALERCVQ